MKKPGVGLSLNYYCTNHPSGVIQVNLTPDVANGIKDDNGEIGWVNKTCPQCKKERHVLLFLGSGLIKDVAGKTYMVQQGIKVCYQCAGATVNILTNEAGQVMHRLEGATTAKGTPVMIWHEPEQRLIRLVDLQMRRTNPSKNIFENQPLTAKRPMKKMA